MWTRFKKHITVLLLLVLLPAAASTAVYGEGKKPEQKREITLTWKSVPGAVRYVVEIRNWWGKEVWKAASWNNRIRIPLEPGRYRMRVTGQNKFKKKHGRSNWRTFLVKSFPPPEVDTLTPDLYKEDGGEVEAVLSGKNFRRGIKIYLYLNDKRIPVEGIRLVSPEKISLRINPRLIGAGKFGIVAVDRNGKSHLEENIFAVEKLPEKDMGADGIIVAGKGKDGDGAKKASLPVFSDISPGRIYITSGIKSFSIQGKNLEVIRSIRLKSTAGIFPVKSLKVSGDSISFSADTDAMSAGTYEVEINSAAGNLQNSLKIVAGDPSRGLAALGGLNVALGYNFALVLPQWNDVYHVSPAGAFLYCGYDFSGFGLPRFLSFLQYFGMEYQFTWNRFTSYDVLNRVDSTLNLFANELGLFAFINLRRDMRIYLRFRGGFAGSMLKYNNALGESTESSFDFDWQTGLAYRYTFRHFYFLEVGSTFHWIHYASERMMNVNFSVMLGLRF